jgi:Predicted membrane protein (DUF2254)
MPIIRPHMATIPRAFIGRTPIMRHTGCVFGNVAGELISKWFKFLDGGSGAFDERRLQGSIALGPERTIEQDSTFAFRVIVDIAIRALSKAINDPTTAVLAIDQLHRLLPTVGGRHPYDEQIMDRTGRLRGGFSNAESGCFRTAGFPRNSPLRRGEFSDCATLARQDRQSGRNPAGRQAPYLASGS